MKNSTLYLLIGLLAVSILACDTSGGGSADSGSPGSGGPASAPTGSGRFVVPLHEPQDITVAWSEFDKSTDELNLYFYSVPPKTGAVVDSLHLAIDMTGPLSVGTYSAAIKHGTILIDFRLDGGTECAFMGVLEELDHEMTVTKSGDIYTIGFTLRVYCVESGDNLNVTGAYTGTLAYYEN